jgi:hypothetical protein
MGRKEVMRATEPKTYNHWLFNSEEECWRAEADRDRAVMERSFFLPPIDTRKTISGLIRDRETRYVGRVHTIGTRGKGVRTMQTTAETGMGLLLTLRETASIIGVGYRRLSLWIRDGIIEPSLRGSIRGGRGNCSCFSVSEAYGLCIATWLWVEPYSQLRLRFFMEDHRRFADMDWSAIEFSLALRDDQWSEESWVKELWQRKGEAPQDYDGPSVDDVLADPEQYANVMRLAKRLMALRNLVLEKMLSGRLRSQRARFYR